MKIGNKEFDLKQDAYIMGILNVTPDSFSDGGRWNQEDLAVEHARQMAAEGAAIIDVGGESARPGYTLLPEEEEIRRVVPVIRRIKKELDIPVSVDTYKSAVAEAAIEAGADLINDIWGLKYDPEMARLAARSGLPVCLTHNRQEPEYTSFLDDVISDLAECIRLGEEAGISRDKMILDPGIGFGKTYEQNLCMMNHLEDLKELGLPVLLGTSRKSMIGLALDLPASEREEGTLATTVLGLAKGCSIFRVHDVKKNYRAMRMAQKILGESYGQN